MPTLADLAALTDPKAVEAAVTEFDAISRDRFLERYGFEPSRDYFLRHEGVLSTRSQSWPLPTPCSFRIGCPSSRGTSQVGRPARCESWNGSVSRWSPGPTIDRRHSVNNTRAAPRYMTSTAETRSLESFVCLARVLSTSSRMLPVHMLMTRRP